MSDLPNADLEGMSYEEALGELERIVATLENTEHPLEESLALYERGQSLARYCADMLDKAELKVQQLSGEDLEEFQA
jgi:exodeoxyribonuclease VII small subunit